MFDRSLRGRIVLSGHGLATDSVFAAVLLLSCRNVLSSFNRELQERALGLFAESLCHKGFLGLGARESLRLSSHEASFTPSSPRSGSTRSAKERTQPPCPPRAPLRPLAASTPSSLARPREGWVP
ncbi:hypothetical protein NR800_15495 [Corallococcus interemptor]|uniref:CheR family methyltransferase n=1 Tax=Corallococcus TaxID=83461 RepID=UPI001CBCF943